MHKENLAHVGIELDDLNRQGLHLLHPRRHFHHYGSDRGEKTN